MVLFILGALVTGMSVLGTATEKTFFQGENQTEDTLRLAVPANFPAPIYDLTGNPLTTAGFSLGRKLFYEPLLSRDGSISCGNCHQYFAAFANLDHPVSHGVDECLGTRNTPPLFNLAWQKEFMWDGGVHHIEVSPLNALTNPCEMAISLDTVTARLRQNPAYPALFRTAFGTAEISSQRVLKALAQFTSLMVSATSRYDRYIRNEPGGQFTVLEEAGYILFREKCSVCHSEPLFTDLSYRSNGLDLVCEDPGRDTITHDPADHGRFKVPTLRNVELTGPYMHDGRFTSLQEVLEHYNSGVKRAANLDTELQKAGRLGISLPLSSKRS